jgi:tetratricopeptide (TPR) repeat protein
MKHPFPSWQPSWSFALLLLLLAPALLFAQVGPVQPGELNARLDSLFTAGEFDEVEVTALRMLHPSRRIEPDDRVAAHLYLGFVWELAGRSDEAREAFLQVLELRPSLQLDRIYVPPRLYSAYQEARRLHEERQELPPELRGEAPPRRPYHTLGTISNLVLPGTGFLVAGETWRGAAWAGAQATVAAGFAYALVRTAEARDTYLAQSNPLRIKEEYDRYDAWYRRSWMLGAGAAAVYLLAQVDYHIGEVRVQPAPATLNAAGRKPVPGLALQLHLP